MKLELSRQIFEKYSSIKFHENPSSESRVPCGRTDITKHIVAFRNFSNGPKNAGVYCDVEGRQNPVIQKRCLCIHGPLEPGLFVWD